MFHPNLCAAKSEQGGVFWSQFISKLLRKQLVSIGWEQLKLLGTWQSPGLPKGLSLQLHVPSVENLSFQIGFSGTWCFPEGFRTWINRLAVNEYQRLCSSSWCDLEGSDLSMWPQHMSVISSVSSCFIMLPCVIGKLSIVGRWSTMVAVSDIKMFFQTHRVRCGSTKARSAVQAWEERCASALRSTGFAYCNWLYPVGFA